MKLFDQIRNVAATSRSIEYKGKIWAIVKESFFLGQHELTRDYMQHMGAVAVLALNKNDEVLTIHQYRHPVGVNMVEIPAGLLDFPEESPLDAAKRELSEESGYVADSWAVLADFCTSPGSSSEAVRIFLARDLSFRGFDASQLDAEEAELDPKWVPISDLINLIEAGQLSSPTAALAITAYKALDESRLRPANSPWPLREHLVATNRVFEQ
jgi:8-oxo-dGTP pyrophosphatase MutT (NUDIX family)